MLIGSLQTLDNKVLKLILDEHPRYSSTTALQRLKATKRNKDQPTKPQYTT